MNTFSFQLDSSLMDRFIALHLNNSDSELVKYVKYGLHPTNNAVLLNKRASWFGKDAAPSWSVDESTESAESIYNEILEATYLMFAILGKEANSTVKNEKKFNGVAPRFKNIVRLSVAENQGITTESQYRTHVCSTDSALQYLLYRLGIAYFSTYGALQLCGQKSKNDKNDKLLDITFGDISNYFSQRIQMLEGKDVIDTKKISSVIYRLNNKRNSESHAAFYTNPDQYWNNLTYILYDYIVLIFFLRRYYEGVLDDSITAVDNEDIEAIKKAIDKSDDFIKNGSEMSVRFQFEAGNEVIRKLSIAEKTESEAKGKQTKTIPIPRKETLGDGRTVCYYEKRIKRFSQYTIQSFFMRNGVDVEDGKELDINTGLLFGGAVVELKMPTTEIPYPAIESIMARATGLIEDSENRAIIEKLLECNIKDDEFRSKLRIILLLDEGEKTKILDEFVRKEDAVSESLDVDAFKKFIEEQNDRQFASIEKRMGELEESLQSLSNEVRKALEEELSRIDLRGLINVNSVSSEDFQALVDLVKNWKEEQDRKIDKTAEESRERDEVLLKAINNLSEEKADIKEISVCIRAEIEKGRKEEERRREEEEKARKEEEQKIKKEEEKKAKNKKIKRLAFSGVGVLLLAALIAYSVVLAVSDGKFVYSSEFNTRAANLFGNTHAAYARAVYLANNHEYPDAARWYMKARDRYARHLAKNPSDSIPALRMAEMLMRGKGGTFDFAEAGKYAEMARRHDIAAYLAAATGDHYKARDIINNYRGSKTSYLELADAVSTLGYPKSAPKFELVQASLNTIDSLASTVNLATEEAKLTASEIFSTGFTDQEGIYFVIPSKYLAIRYATEADAMFNSLRSQLFLMYEFARIKQYDIAKEYYTKASSNGWKDIEDAISGIASVNELAANPVILLMRALNNAEKGFNDYRMAAHYYHLADSIRNTKHIGVFGQNFYSEWFDLIAKAPDLSSAEQLMPLISKEFSDSIKSAIADYIMSVKYANGYGVPLDSIKSVNYLTSAASKGLSDAQVALGISLDIAGDPEGMKLLHKHVYDIPVGHAHNAAVKYLVSKSLNTTGRVEYKLVNQLNADELALQLQLSIIESRDLMNYKNDEIWSLYEDINLVLAENPDHSQFSYLYGKLAEINYILGRFDETDFFIKAANTLSPVSAYTSFYGLSEMARLKRQFHTAYFFAEMFAEQFFLDNGKVLDESNRSEVIEHFYHLYPEILELVHKKKNYDFAENEIFFHNVGFDRDRDFSTFDTRVRRLHVDLPNYQKPTFPVTKQYFD